MNPISNQKYNKDNPVIFSIKGKYAHPYAYKLFKKLVDLGYINVEKIPWEEDFAILGVAFEFEGLKINMSGDGQELYIQRLSGSKKKFYDFIDLLQKLKI